MKKMRIITFIVFPLFLFSYTSIPHSFTFVVLESTSLTTSGNPASLIVNIPTSGFAQAVDSSTTYSVSSNNKNKKNLKITGMISSGGNMPTGTSLKIRLTSSAGSSSGSCILSTRSIDLVTKIPSIISERGQITYTFTVENGWMIPAQSLTRAITLTLIADN